MFVYYPLNFICVSFAIFCQSLVANFITSLLGRLLTNLEGRKRCLDYKYYYNYECTSYLLSRYYENAKYIVGNYNLPQTINSLDINIKNNYIKIMILLN